jgi:hypothetical protein
MLHLYKSAFARSLSTLLSIGVAVMASVKTGFDAGATFEYIPKSMSLTMIRTKTNSKR